MLKPSFVFCRKRTSLWLDIFLFMTCWWSSSGIILTDKIVVETVWSCPGPGPAYHVLFLIVSECGDVWWWWPDHGPARHNWWRATTGPAAGDWWEVAQAPSSPNIQPPPCVRHTPTHISMFTFTNVQHKIENNLDVAVKNFCEMLLWWNRGQCSGFLASVPRIFWISNR